jgi:hypothetical protein
MQLPAHWIPYRLITQETEPLVQWLYTHGERFTEPFFDETIQKCRARRSYEQLKNSVSSLSLLTNWATSLSSLPPSGIIFHVSRCGSTLLSQLLSLSPQHIVLSEVPFFDELLRWQRNNDVPQQARLQQLEAALKLYTVPYQGETHCFIKPDSWHIFFYPLLRQLFPATPFFLLYRHPAEVLRSQQKQRGMHAIPGFIEPSLFGLEESVVQMDFSEYMALVLEKYFAAFASILQHDNNVIPVNYKSGAIAMIETIAARTGFTPDEAMRQQMQARAGYHAKYPDQPFGTEAEVTQIPAYLEKAMKQYEAVERLRAERG